MDCLVFIHHSRYCMPLLPVNNWFCAKQTTCPSLVVWWIFHMCWCWGSFCLWAKMMYCLFLQDNVQRHYLRRGARWFCTRGVCTTAVTSPLLSASHKLPKTFHNFHCCANFALQLLSICFCLLEDVMSQAEWMLDPRHAWSCVSCLLALLLTHTCKSALEDPNTTQQFACQPHSTVATTNSSSP